MEIFKEIYSNDNGEPQHMHAGSSANGNATQHDFSMVANLSKMAVDSTKQRKMPFDKHGSGTKAAKEIIGDLKHKDKLSWKPEKDFVKWSEDFLTIVANKEAAHLLEGNGGRTCISRADLINLARVTKKAIQSHNGRVQHNKMAYDLQIKMLSTQCEQVGKRNLEERLRVADLQAKIDSNLASESENDLNSDTDSSSSSSNSDEDTSNFDGTSQSSKMSTSNSASKSGQSSLDSSQNIDSQEGELDVKDQSEAGKQAQNVTSGSPKVKNLQTAKSDLGMFKRQLEEAKKMVSVLNAEYSEISNKILDFQMKLQEPDWTKKVVPTWIKTILDQSTVCSNNANTVAATFKSPHRAGRVNIDDFDVYQSDLSQYDKRAQADKIKVMNKAKERDVFFVVNYDTERPLQVRMETQHDDEARNFIWQLFTYCFQSQGEAFLEKFDYRDVYSVWSYIWKTFHNRNQNHDDKELRDMQNISMCRNENLNAYLERADKLWKDLNSSGFIIFNETQFQKYMLQGLSNIPRFNDVLNIIYGDKKYGDNLDLTKRQLVNAEKTYNERQNAARFRVTRGVTARSALVEVDKVKKQREEKKKVKQKRKGEGEIKAMVAETVNALFAAHESQKAKDKKSCFYHEKYGACPFGSNCRYHHDPKDGDPNRVKPTAKVSCQYCKGNHWNKDCTDKRAVEGREKKKKKKQVSKHKNTNKGGVHAKSAFVQMSKDDSSNLANLNKHVIHTNDKSEDVDTEIDMSHVSSGWLNSMDVQAIQDVNSDGQSISDGIAYGKSAVVMESDADNNSANKTRSQDTTVNEPNKENMKSYVIAESKKVISEIPKKVTVGRLPYRHDYMKNIEVYEALVDTGCTMHLLKDRNHFVSLYPLPEPIPINGVNNVENCLTAKFAGVAYVATTNGFSLKLAMALYVPEIEQSLISGSILSSSLKVVCENHVMIITHKERSKKNNPTVIAKIRSTNGVFPLKYWIPEHVNLMNQERSGNAGAHERLKNYAPEIYAMIAMSPIQYPGLSEGQRNHNRTHRVGFYKNYGLPDIKDKAVCQACPFGDGQWLENRKSTHRNPTRPGQIIGMDAQGPFMPDVYGNRYNLAFHDYFNRYEFCVQFAYPHEWRGMADRVLAKYLTILNKGKIQTLDIVGKVTDMDELPVDRNIAILRMDNQPDLTSAATKEWARKNGIVIEHIVPRDHSQGGAAEGQHSHSNRATVKFLTNGNAPHAFWSFTKNQNTNINNIHRRSPDSKSPYEQIGFNITGDMKNEVLRLRAMFCLAIVTLSREERQKLGLRTWVGINLGLSDHDGVKGHYVLMMETGIIIIAKSSTTFNESVFPFRDERVWKHFGFRWKDYTQSITLTNESASQDGIAEQLEADKNIALPGAPPYMLSPTLHLGIAEEQLFTVEAQAHIDDSNVHHDNRGTHCQRGRGVPTLRIHDNEENISNMAKPLELPRAQDVEESSMDVGVEFDSNDVIDENADEITNEIPVTNTNNEVIKDNQRTLLISGVKSKGGWKPTKRGPRRSKRNQNKSGTKETPKRSKRRARFAYNNYSDDNSDKAELSSSGEEQVYEAIYLHAPNKKNPHQTWRKKLDHDDEVEEYVRIKWKNYNASTWEPLSSLADGPLKSEWLKKYSKELDRLKVIVVKDISKLKSDKKSTLHAKSMVTTLEDSFKTDADVKDIDYNRDIDIVNVYNNVMLHTRDMDSRYQSIQSQVANIFGSEIYAFKAVSTTPKTTLGQHDFSLRPEIVPEFDSASSSIQIKYDNKEFKILRKNQQESLKAYMAEKSKKVVNDLQSFSPTPIRKSLYDIEMPTSLKAIWKTPFGPQFFESYLTEVVGLITRGVFIIVPYKETFGKLMGNKLLFSIKLLGDGGLDKFKCRLVAQGFSQIAGLNYNSDELYSPVVSLNTIRLLLTLFAAMSSVEFFHFDVSQAFLWAVLTEDIYVRGFDGRNLPSG